MTLSALFSQMPWLTLLLALPLVGGLLCMLADPEEKTGHWLALVTTGLTFAIALGLFITHGDGAPGWLLQEDAAWIERYGIRYSLGMDGLSLVEVAHGAVGREPGDGIDRLVIGSGLGHDDLNAFDACQGGEAVRAHFLRPRRPPETVRGDKA